MENTKKIRNMHRRPTKKAITHGTFSRNIRIFVKISTQHIKNPCNHISCLRGNTAPPHLNLS